MMDRLVSSATGIDGDLTSLWGYRQIDSDTVLEGPVMLEKVQGLAAVARHTWYYTHYIESTYWFCM